MKVVSPDAKLVMVGDGPARAAFERSTPDAIFAGKRFGEDLARHYASADVLLFPSTTETFGNATLEAMASGLAVIAFGYGAAGEYIRSGENGWTVPYEDEAEYLSVSESAAGDLAAIRRLGARARMDSQSLGWDKILTQIEGHYRTAINSGRTGSASGAEAGQESLSLVALPFANRPASQYSRM
jgi:glycosyltransferase involved in cell wall biosynthesis